MPRLKTLFTASAAVLGIALASLSQATPIITITDLTDGPPTLAVTSGVDIIGGTTVLGPESATFDATLHIPFGDGVLNLTGGPSVFLLTEGGPGTPLSDWIQVSTPQGTGGSGAVDWQQFIHVEFLSDVDGVPLGQPAGNVICALAETGQLQTCSLTSQTGAHILDLQIQSDVEGVPEPATLALVGIALAAGGFRRRKAATV